MTYENRTKLAWELIKEGIKTADLPKNIEIKDDEDGGLIFSQCNFQGNSGYGVFTYKPDITNFTKFLSFLESNTYTCEEGKAEEVQMSYTKHLITYFLKLFSDHVKDAFTDVIKIPELLTFEVEDFIMNYSGSPGEFMATCKGQINKALEVYFKEQSVEKRERIVKKIISDEEEKLSSPSIHLMNYYYLIWHPYWKEAKDYYKKGINKRNKRISRNWNKSWQQLVKDEFDHLPEDMIDLLNDSGYGPSELALEHAARFCGLEPFSKSRQTLYNLREGSKQWMENNPEQIEPEQLNYKMFNLHIAQQYIDKILANGKDPDFEGLNYMQKVIVETFWKEHKNKQNNNQSN